MELQIQMSKLRLHGMSTQWQTLDETRQITELSLCEGLELLMQAEQEYRENSRYQRLQKSARFRYQASIEELKFDASRGLNKDQITRLAQNKFINTGEAVLITGATGCGKSFVASALGNKACANGFKVAYHNMQKLLLHLKMCRADGTYLKFCERLAKTHLLIIDDFGLTNLQRQEGLDFLEILEDRHAKNATIIASQLPVNKWYDVFAEQTIADAILDRLVHTAHRIELKGESRRRKSNQ